MGRYILPIIFKILFLSSIAFETMAGEVYVSTTGSNRNIGSFSSPLRTIQHALNLARAGTIIYVRGGIFSERLMWKNSGTASSPIILTNYGREVVYLDGNNATNSNQLALLEILNKSHIQINGLRLQNNYRKNARGIHIHGKGTRVAVTNCKISNIGRTRKVDSIPVREDNANPFVIVGDSATSYNYLNIRSNEISNCITGYSENLTITGNVERFEVRTNRIHDNTNIGIVIAGHYSWTATKFQVNQARNGKVIANTVYRCVSKVATSAGIYVDGGYMITIEGNKCFENGAGISLGCENPNRTASRIIVRSNFIYNNIKAGIIVGANASGSKVESSSIYNNTFYKNCSDGKYGGEIHLQNTSGITFKNNIINSRTNVVVIALDSFTSTGLAMDYNQYYTASGSGNAINFNWHTIDANKRDYSSLASFKSGTGLETNGRYANPFFVSATLPSPNLHLSSISPAINSSDPGFTPALSERDVDGQARLQSIRVDVGADETSYTNSPAARIALVEEQLPLKIYPNPASKYIYLNTNALIRIVPNNGAVVLTGNYRKGERVLLVHLPNGVYFVINERNNSTIKLIINN